MKITDKKRTIEITIRHWDGSSYGEDWSEGYFDAGSLQYDEETGAYIVPDVDYCIDMAMSADEGGACCKYDEGGNLTPDDSAVVDVTEL